MTDWVTISALATAGTTLVLAAATLTSVRAASRAAAAAERSVLTGMRPVLLNSRLGDREEKVFWVDDHWTVVQGGHAYAAIVNDNIYLAISVRNVGSGLAVLQGWDASASLLHAEIEHTRPGDFRRMIRDLFVPAQDVGYWHAAIRDVDDPLYAQIAGAMNGRQSLTIELLYSDAEGGQSSISRFALRPRGDAGTDWIAATSRHWNLDRPDPRSAQYS